MEDGIEQHRQHVQFCVKVVVQPKFAKILVHSEEEGNVAMNGAAS